MVACFTNTLAPDFLSMPEVCKSKQSIRLVCVLCTQQSVTLFAALRSRLNTWHMYSDIAPFTTLSKPLVCCIAFARCLSCRTFFTLLSHTSLLAFPGRAVPDWLRCVHCVPPALRHWLPLWSHLFAVTIYCVSCAC